ncbi:MAG: transcription antitermination factor NusB [Bowdeniella nasicola]|nr:transcription antitermination factor NusB [Bowdeniella nasicola]
MTKPRSAKSRRSAHNPRFTRRTRERIRAIDVLFEADQRNLMRPEALKTLVERREAETTRQTPLPSGAKRIVLGVADHLAHIDYSISSYTERWPLERMPAVDRAILRAATWELLYDDDAVGAVVINEAVSIAQALSTDKSPRFLNGILDTIASIAPGLRAQEAAFDADNSALVAAALAHEEDEPALDFSADDDDEFAAYGWFDANDFDTQAPAPQSAPEQVTSPPSDVAAPSLPQPPAPPANNDDCDAPKPTAQTSTEEGSQSRDPKRADPQVDRAGEPAASPRSGDADTPPAHRHAESDANHGENDEAGTRDAQLAANDPLDPNQPSLFA